MTAIFLPGDQVIWWDPDDEMGDWPGEIVEGPLYIFGGNAYLVLLEDETVPRHVQSQWLKLRVGEDG